MEARDGGRRRDRTATPKDRSSKRPRSRRRVKIITQPEHASLYIDRNYSGKGGTTLERPDGTVLTVECRLDGYN